VPNVNIGMATMLGGEFPHLAREIMFSRPNVTIGNHACLPSAGEHHAQFQQDQMKHRA